MTGESWREEDLSALHGRIEQTVRDMCTRDYGGACALGAVTMTALDSKEAMFDMACAADCPFAGSLHRAVMLAVREMQQERGLGPADIEL